MYTYLGKSLDGIIEHVNGWKNWCFEQKHVKNTFLLHLQKKFRT